MFTRLIRLADRIGRVTVKVSTWLGAHFVLSYAQIAYRLKGRLGEAALDTDATRTEAQVQSLSGLTVLLLVSVVALIFWATSTSNQGKPVIQLFEFGTPSGPAGQDDLAAAQPTPIPEVSQLRAPGTIVFSMITGTQEDLFALVSGQTTLVRLTNDPADDRDPAWSPDGQRIAFASHRDGNWELYILEMQTGEVRRLTIDSTFEGAPTWSPDGVFLAYEGYNNGNLDIYLIKTDGSEGPIPITHDPAPDFAPEWGPGTGRTIAYVSLRDGNQEIYLLSLDRPDEYTAVNLTETPNINEDEPTWSPDGSFIAYSAVENGIPLVYTKPVSNPSADPTVVGQGHFPTWSPDSKNLVFFAEPESDPTGGSLLLNGQFGSWADSAEVYKLPAQVSDPSWTASSLPATMQGSLAFASTEPLPGPFVEPITAGQEGQSSLYLVKTLPGIDAELAYLSDRVDGAFVTLRDHTNQAAGWDFLGRLDSVYWGLDRRLPPGVNPQDWHKAGRAFDIKQAYNQGNPAQIELVPEQIGPDLYWRMYIRAAVQDGSQGEPLRHLPWDFYARASEDVIAYDAGGRVKSPIPPGYYVDFTRLAQMYGWMRTPSGGLWASNWPTILYWQYEKRDGLDWRTAMLELYDEQALAEVLTTSTPAPTTARTAIPTSTHGSTGTPRPAGTQKPGTVTAVPHTPTPDPSRP